MTNEKEKLAREWAESKLAMPTGHLDADVIAAAEHILATTPKPTMADAEWDDEKHFLAGATHKETNAPLVMIGPVMADKTTDCVALSLKCGYQVENHNLTPNGKRYELREAGAPEEPEHPETLTTVEDYENAPEGTIVSVQGAASVWVKSDGKWRRCDYDTRTSTSMAGIPRTVLRKGWGE